MDIAIAWGTVLTTVLVLWGLRLFNGHCQQKFGYGFFSWKAMGLFVLGAFVLSGARLLLTPGISWHSPSAAIVMGLVGLVLLGYGAYRNFRSAPWPYAVGGTLLQVLVYGFVGNLLFNVALLYHFYQPIVIE